MAMNFEKNLMLKELKYFEEVSKAYSWETPQQFKKDAKISINLRKEGNHVFARKNHTSKDHEKIWILYNQSIATAPNNSEELAAGYANRSALLIHLRKYKDCLVDINRALKITSSNSLKVKLFCRQTECLVELRDEKKNKSLVKAKFWLNKIDDGEKRKKNLVKVIEKAEDSLKKKVPKVKASETLPAIKVLENAVYISYNSKLGRGLSAAQDLKAGQFIYEEKFCVVSCNNNLFHRYCSHCLSISWTAVPCDSCSCYMFCGEKCKKEAWQKYHDIECSLHLTIDTHVDYVQMSIRLLIQGFKEAGSIENLKNMVEEVDKCTDEKTKGISKNEKFLSDSFRSIYSLRSAKSQEKMNIHIRNTLHILIAFVKKTTIFGTDINCDNAKDNKDILFMGTLLLRLKLILILNAFHTLDPSFDCKKGLNPLVCAYNRCCAKGMDFSPNVSLFNHSCDSNVSKFYTNNGSVVYYTIKHVPKGTQLFSNYYYTYSQFVKEGRQKMLKELFEFNCECIACKNNFSYGYSQFACESDAKVNVRDFFIFKKLMERNQSFNLTKGKNKLYRFDEKTIRNYAEDVDNLWKNAKRPAPIFQIFSLTLSKLMTDTYGTRFHIPKDCKP